MPLTIIALQSLMNRLSVFATAACFLFTASLCGDSITTPPEEFEPLFKESGEPNWYVTVRDQGRVEEQDYFTLKNGVIHAYKNKPDGSPQPYAALFTKESYQSYHLRLEYRWGKTKHPPRHDFVRDAGVIYHTIRSETVWPDGVECQIQEGDTGDLWIIGTRASSKVSRTIRNYSPKGELQTLGDPERRFHRFHRGYCWEVPGWNRVDILVEGDHSVFKVNGRVVNEAIDTKQWDVAQKKWVPLASGPIVLQAEGAEILYRNVEIKRLD